MTDRDLIDSLQEQLRQLRRRVAALETGSAAPYGAWCGRVTPDAVINACSRYFRVTPDEICNGTKARRVCYARWVAMYLARRHTTASYLELGRAFGRRHHSTVLNAVTKTDERRTDKPGLQDDLDAVEILLGLRPEKGKQ